MQDMTYRADFSSLGLFLRYLGASVAGLLALTSAAIVDGLLIGKWLGAEALAAVNLLIPLWTTLFGLVLMLAIGASVAASRYLGAGRALAASRVLSGSLRVALLGGAGLALLVWWFDDTVLTLLAVPEALRALIRPYLHWVLLGQVPLYLAVVLYYFLRVAGEPRRASRALVLGALVNIALDVLLLAGLGWDLRGAALATVMAQLTQCGLLLSLWRRGGVRLLWVPVRPGLRRLLRFCANGFSEFVNEMSAGLVLLALHWLLSRHYGVAGVAGFALIHYGLLLNIMLACALAEVVHVLVSRSLGAGQPHLARRYRRYGLLCAALFGATLWGAVQWGADPLTGWFFGDKARASATYARDFWAAVGPVFWLTGFNLVLSAWFTGSLQPGRSAAIALARSLILPLSLLGLFALAQKPHWYLWSLPLAEVLTLLLASLLLAQKIGVRRLLPQMG